MRNCPKCESAKVTVDNATKFDISLHCHECGFEFTVSITPETKMRSVYDANTGRSMAIAEDAMPPE